MFSRMQSCRPTNSKSVLPKLLLHESTVHWKHCQMFEAWNFRKMTVWLLLIFFVAGEISGRNPRSGTCVCTSESGAYVHSSECGRVIGQVRRGQCFRSKGVISPCISKGNRTQFLEIHYGYGSGWIIGRHLVTGNSSQCQKSPSSVSGVCPRIVSRSEWGTKAPTSASHIRHPVQKIIIHHTNSSSCRTQSECTRSVRALENYQTHSRKWTDSGYNFLVGEDGNVYEGRGWNRIGVHSSKWNSVSIGIAVIGNFQNSAPNATIENVVKQLIACGVNTRKISKSYTIHGHRDGVCSKCPGDAFHLQIKTWPRYGGRLSTGEGC